MFFGMTRTLLVFLGLFFGGAAVSRLDYLDMVFVIDDSSRLREFHRDRTTLLFQGINQLIYRVYENVHSPRLGLVFYNDRPLLHYMPHAKIATNYCSRLMQPLTNTPKFFMDQLNQLNFVGQASDDNTETDAYGGIMKALNRKMRWRDSTTERPVTRLIVLIAGAEPCRAGQGLYNSCRQLRSWANNGDFYFNCLQEDYYTQSQVVESLKKRDVMLYVFTWYGYFQPYRDLVRLLGRGRVYTLMQDFDKVATQLISTDGVQPSSYESVRDLPDDSEEEVQDPDFPEKAIEVPEMFLKMTVTWEHIWRDFAHFPF